MQKIKEESIALHRYIVCPMNMKSSRSSVLVQSTFHVNLQLKNRIFRTYQQGINEGSSHILIIHNIKYHSWGFIFLILLKLFLFYHKFSILT